MTRQAIEPVDELTNEDASELGSSLFADLELADTESNEIKAGSGTWTPTGFNHNETLAEDDATTSAPLADLPVEDAEQVKGGSTYGRSVYQLCLEDGKVGSV